MEGQDLTLYEGSIYQGEQVNSSGPYYADPMGHFGHLVAEVFNVLSGFVYESHFFARIGKAHTRRKS